jgi:signal peptidase II
MFPEVLVSAGWALVIDQASKRLVLRSRGLGLRSASSTGLRPQLRPVLNRTIGLGLVSDRRVVLILWSLVVLAAMLLIYHAPAFQRWAPCIGAGAALGGATSNLMDWLRRGAVVDFIDLRVWPVFNLADAFIVLGVGVALWSTY